MTAAYTGRRGQVCWSRQWWETRSEKQGGCHFTRRQYSWHRSPPHCRSRRSVTGTDRERGEMVLVQNSSKEQLIFVGSTIVCGLALHFICQETEEWVLLASSGDLVCVFSITAMSKHCYSTVVVLKTPWSLCGFVNKHKQMIVFRHCFIQTPLCL